MRKQGTPTSQVTRFGHLRMWDRDHSNQRATLTNIGPQFQTSWATARTSDGSTLDPLSSPLSCMSLPFNSTAKRSGWMRPQSPYTSPTSRIYYERHYHRAAGTSLSIQRGASCLDMKARGLRREITHLGYAGGRNNLKRISPVLGTSAR